MKLAKTEVGQQVLKDRSVRLTPRQRSAFILCDGRNDIDQVLAATRVMGVSRDDIQHLLDVGLVVAQADALEIAADEAQQLLEGRDEQQRYQDAYPIAAGLTSGLGLKGFRLNLAVEHAGNCEQLRALAPRIRQAVGEAAYAPLHRALNS